MTEFDNQIKYFREKKNMTQRDLAESLGTDIRNVRRWENGEASMDVLKAIKIAKILGVSVEVLFDL